MSTTSIMMPTIYKALIFGAQELINCEKEIDHLDLSNFKNLSLEELKRYKEELQDLNPKMGQLSLILHEKSKLLDEAEEKFTQLCNGIQSMILEKNQPEGNPQEVLSDNSPKVEMEEKLTEEKTEDLKVQENHTDKAGYQVLEKDKDAQAKVIPPFLPGTSEPPYDRVPLPEVNREGAVELEESIFQLNDEQFWKIKKFIELYHQLTFHHTNPYDLLKALRSLQFDDYRKYFKSNNKFLVWMDCILQSGFIRFPKEWLRAFLHSKRLKGTWDVLRKCRNVHVLKCCQEVDIQLNIEQRTWAAQRGVLLDKSTS